MPTATYFDLLKQAQQQGADTPEDLQRAQPAPETTTGLDATGTLNNKIAQAPPTFQKLYQTESNPEDQQPVDPALASNALLAAANSGDDTNSSGTYDFDSAIRNRLAGITDIGTQQNNFVQQKALAAQQSALQGQFDSTKAGYEQSLGQGTQNGVAGTFTQTGFVPSRNPRSAQEAIAWAKAAAANGDSGWYRQCLAFVARAYGLPSSGTNYAIDAFNRLPAGQKSTDRNPQPGSLVFWKGSSAPGHVAIYLGNGMIASTDISGAGKIGIVPFDTIEKKWGQRYVGWSLPNFATTRK